MCEYPSAQLPSLLKRKLRESLLAVPELYASYEEAPIDSERAVSLCFPALLTSSLPTECAQRTGASLIPLIWGAPWDLTKHSSDKDMRSQRCRGIPTVGSRQTGCECVCVREREMGKCFLQYMRTLTWHHPHGGVFFPPSPISLSLFTTLSPSAVCECLSQNQCSKCKPDRWPSSLTWARLRLQYSALLLKPSSWLFTPTEVTQIIQLLCQKKGDTPFNC